MGLFDSAAVIVSTSSGHKIVKNNKEQKDPEVLEWEREIKKRKQMKAEQNTLEPILKDLFHAVETNSKDKAVAVFIEFAIKRGFKNEEWFNRVEKAFLEIDGKIILGFTKFLTNQYLKTIEGCYKQQRGIKFKQVKYQFETKPKSEKELDKESDTKRVLQLFFNRMLEEV